MLSFSYSTLPTEIYTLSLHDALPICGRRRPRSLAAGELEDARHHGRSTARGRPLRGAPSEGPGDPRRVLDRKSTRLNSSHLGISYAVFCLKKKKNMRSATSTGRKQRT